MWIIRQPDQLRTIVVLFGKGYGPQNHLLGKLEFRLRVDNVCILLPVDAFVVWFYQLNNGVRLHSKYCKSHKCNLILFIYIVSTLFVCKSLVTWRTDMLP